MKILVISLPKSKRRELIIEEMKKYNLDFEFSDGVLIKTYDDMKPYMEEFELIDTGTDDKKSGRMGDIGYTLAVIKAFKYIKDNHIQWTLLTEDDIVFEKDSVKRISEYTVYNGWLMVHELAKKGQGTIGQVVSIDIINTMWEKRQYIFDCSLYTNGTKQLDELIINYNMIEWKDSVDFGLPYLLNTYLERNETAANSERINLNEKL